MACPTCRFMAGCGLSEGDDVLGVDCRCAAPEPAERVTQDLLLAPRARSQLVRTPVKSRSWGRLMRQNEPCQGDSRATSATSPVA